MSSTTGSILARVVHNPVTPSTPPHLSSTAIIAESPPIVQSLPKVVHNCRFPKHRYRFRFRGEITHSPLFQPRSSSTNHWRSDPTTGLNAAAAFPLTSPSRMFRRKMVESTCMTCSKARLFPSQAQRCPSNTLLPPGHQSTVAVLGRPSARFIPCPLTRSNEICSRPETVVERC